MAYIVKKILFFIPSETPFHALLKKSAILFLAKNILIAKSR